MAMPFTVDEVTHAIKALHTNKACDEFGIKAEALQGCSKVVSPILLDLFNQCYASKLVPQHFKTGITTSIPKKGKAPEHLDNHRGITINTTIGKVFEYMIRKRIQPSIRATQSPLQVGFTSGISPSIGTLIIHECAIEAKEKKLPLYVCTKDTKKAFDTDYHDSLIRKIYNSQIPLDMLVLIDKLYENSTTKIKWKDVCGEPFVIRQGTRQGGILSADLYKLFVNDLLLAHQEGGVGAVIGDIYLGCPTIADDMSLLANEHNDLQVMIDTSGDYANRERYEYNPTKCEIANLGSVCADRETWYINSDPIHLTDTVSHLGLSHSSNNPKYDDLVDGKVCQLFKTAYSLLGAGLHGTSGVGPKVAIQIYKIYVLPRVLYGLSAIVLTTSQTEKLEKAHRKVIRQIQSLPDRVAIPAVYLLAGMLPMEGLLHISQLSILNTIIHSGNDTLTDLATRQIAMKKFGSKSWFVCISKILIKYNLPSVLELINAKPGKEMLKSKFKKSIHQFWTQKLRNDCKSKSTLVMLNEESGSTSTPHPVWSTVSDNVRDIQRGYIKARLVTDTYSLQVHSAKFRSNESPICRLCNLDIEDRTHFLIECSALFESRSKWIDKIKFLIVDMCGRTDAEKLLSDHSTFLQVILDCSQFKETVFKKSPMSILQELETLTRLHCFSQHFQRAHLLKLICNTLSNSSSNSEATQPTK